MGHQNKTGTTGTTGTLDYYGRMFNQLKSSKSIKYDITQGSATSMPKLGKGTECSQILLSEASKDMLRPLIPMLFPVLGAYISVSEYQYPDLTWKEFFVSNDPSEGGFGL